MFDHLHHAAVHGAAARRIVTAVLTEITDQGPDPTTDEQTPGEAAGEQITAEH